MQPFGREVRVAYRIREVIDFILDGLEQRDFDACRRCLLGRDERLSRLVLGAQIRGDLVSHMEHSRTGASVLR